MNLSSVAILEAAVSGRRLSADEGLALLQSHDLAALGRAADAVTRRLHPEPFRTYNVDRNINYTNICTSGCRFCAFSRKLGDPDGYVISRDELYRKIEETIALGGDQILLQGGMHPELKIDWYEDLLRDIKRRFPAGQRAWFQPAGDRPHRDAFPGLSIRDVLERLKAAGLGSLARRRGGNPGRSRPARGQPVQGLGRSLAGSLPRVARDLAAAARPR